MKGQDVSLLLASSEKVYQHRKATAYYSGKYDNYDLALSLSGSQIKDEDFFSDFVTSDRFSSINRQLRVDLMNSGQHPYRDNNLASWLSFWFQLSIRRWKIKSEELAF